MMAGWLLLVHWDDKALVKDIQHLSSEVTPKERLPFLCTLSHAGSVKLREGTCGKVPADLGGNPVGAWSNVHGSFAEGLE